MTQSLLYHDGNRALQEQFQSRRMADRLEQLTRSEFADSDRSFIESAIYFFLATSDPDGQPDVSFKGGPPGFVRVTGPDELAFPDYDGNGMFRSLGNLSVWPKVGLLFIAMHGVPRRLRISGDATISSDDPLLGQTVGAQIIVRVKARAIFPNCPRYVPRLALVEPSPYIPVAAQDFVEPGWKSSDTYRDFVHPRAPTFRG
ncbi:MAG: pyridoxamine 5'-phosphate oxidase family protein [Devosia sp.]